MQTFKHALDYSFLLLKYRSRSKNEIISRLKRKKISCATINKVLSYLRKYNYINDREFSQQFVSAKCQKGWGQRKIFSALKKLGVSDELIRRSLGDKETYRNKIKEIIDRKINHYKEPNKCQKTLRYLLSRGFDYQDIISELQNYPFDKFSKD